MRLLLIMLLCCSCAKTAYIAEQARGQIGLQWSGRDNQEVLSDASIAEQDKEKIRLVETYREWFFKYWQRKPDDIYSKTTMLEDEAVTWLVITSPWNEVKAVKECFPITGCFPYLGFFKKKSAEEWIEDKKEEGLQTWMRPVYAYSTLGYFEDRILSSFFHYDKYELAELVFHELFHVMYFLKDNVDFNENLANFFGEQMAREYFTGHNDDGYDAWKARLKASNTLRKVVATGARELDGLYKAKPDLKREEAQVLMNDYIENNLRPALEAGCKEAGLATCKIAKADWNNARLAATMTYEKAAPDFERLFKTHGNDLKALLAYIKQRETEFEDSDQKDFTEFLFSDRMVENAQ